MALYIAFYPPLQPSREKSGRDREAEASGAKNPSRRKGAASVTNTEADGHHRGTGAAAAQSFLQQLCFTPSTAGDTGHSEQPNTDIIYRFCSR